MKKDKGFIILTEKADCIVSTHGVNELVAMLQKEHPEAFVLCRKESEIPETLEMTRIKIIGDLKIVAAGQYLAYYFECEGGD
jgi:hypothetical protein